MCSSFLPVLRDSALALLLAAGLAVGVNALRSTGGIPLLAPHEYEILVPCPELAGQPASALSADQLSSGEPGTLLVDARERADFEAWHLPGAISLPFDYLEPRPEEQTVLRSRARKVVVYGDGQEPDSGQQLANALSGKGVKNVHYVVGGAPALRRPGAP